MFEKTKLLAGMGIAALLAYTTLTTGPVVNEKNQISEMAVYQRMAVLICGALALWKTQNRAIGIAGAALAVTALLQLQMAFLVHMDHATSPKKAP